jgi:hypothetical protein
MAGAAVAKDAKPVDLWDLVCQRRERKQTGASEWWENAGVRTGANLPDGLITNKPFFTR